MSTGADLTRWNRAGLARFRYLDGNAAEFLELLRADLAGKFPDWTAVRVPPGETDADRSDRLTRQYGEQRRDLAWEIIRAFARACHVLGEHVDAYANEGFLRTATQWDSVRKLVAMLGVQPSPPASASTSLVIDAKGAPGMLAAGFGARYAPKDGGVPVIFETLEELALDPSLNALRLAGWNRSPAPITPPAPVFPLSAIARRGARAVQGVGPRLQALLDAQTALAKGTFPAVPGAQTALAKGTFPALPGAHTAPGRRTFTVADFRWFNPAVAGGRHTLRLWEAKSKAEILLDFPWTTAELARLARRRLPDLLAQDPRQLASEAGRTTADMVRFLEDLRTAEIALDEEVFRATRLEDLLSPGPAPEDPPPAWAAPSASGISAGQVALVVRATAGPQDARAVPALGGPEQAAVVRINRADTATGALTLEPMAYQPAWENWPRGVSSLLANPRLVAVPRLTGAPHAVTFAAPHGLSAGGHVGWQAGGTWTFADVQQADSTALLLSGTAPPPAGTEIFRAVEVRREAAAEGPPLPFGYQAAAATGKTGWEVVRDEDRREEREQTAHGAGAVRYYTITRPGTSRALFVPGSARPAGRAASVAAAGGDGKFRFDGKPGDLRSGQWVIGDDGGRLLALRIDRVETLEDHFAVTFASVAEPAPQVATENVSILTGVGPVAAHALGQAKLATVGQLAGAPATAGVRGLSRTEYLEARAKAKLVTGFPFGERELRPILDRTLPEVLAEAGTLADELGKPPAWAAELTGKLRLLQAVADEPSFTRLHIRDLLPIGAPQPVEGYPLTRLDRLYGAFEHTIRPRGWDRNDTPVTGSRLALEHTPPAAGAHGRRLVLEREAFAREAVVTAADPAAGTLDITPAITADEGFTAANLVLRANVVRAGHGEARPGKVLGSGDATQLRQSFVLRERGVTFIADPAQPTGVAAAVTVTVAGQGWQQVATLRDSGPSDSHFAVQLTEDGYLAFTFGDGTHGRRLPTGASNVQVSYRTGTGLAGNLPPGSLTIPVRPDPLVSAVRQPLPATGGNDLEDVASLRTQAPRSLLTLERAVSLADFTALAARQASIWQARAFALPAAGSRQAPVEVVVVPAGGGALGPIAADLQSFLVTNALPGVRVEVSRYQPRPFDLLAEIEVAASEPDPAVVGKGVEKALLDAFSLRRRALGASLFASELYAVIERVTSVEAARVSMGFGSTGSQSVLRATDRQVIFLDPALSRFTVTVRQFEL